MSQQSLIIRYTNWKNNTRIRTIKPIKIYFGKTEWHPEEQWLMKAIDLEDGEVKDFALKDMEFKFNN